MNFSLVGAGAGLVSALLIAVVAKATPLALLLFLLAPIPVLIVTLGWDHRAGLVACLTGGLATALALSPIEGIGFAVGTGLPAWWLGYLALLGKAQPSGAVDWYPLGRLLAWIAATAALTVLATAIVSSSGDFASFHGRMRRIADLFFQAQLRGPPGAPKPADDALIEAVAQRFAALAPMFAAQGFTLILTAYVWIGAKVVALSEGVLKAMFVSKIKSVGLALALVAVAALVAGGLFAATRQHPDPDGATEGAKFLDDPSPAGESLSAYAGSNFRTLLSV